VWHKADPPDVKKWANGFDDWNNHGKSRVWEDHTSSLGHKPSVEHLYNRFSTDVRQSIMDQHQAF